MKKLLTVIVALPGLLFTITGLRWLTDPAGSAAGFGMPVLEGVGLSTQIGDLSAFFLVLGLCILIALITSRRVWYYPAILLLSLTAIGRILAWLLHDATLAVQMIAPEVIISILLLIASRILPEKE